MKKLSFIIVFVFLSILFVQAQQAKYVFYFIGDGMGVNQVLGTEMYRGELEGKIGVTPLLFTQFPYATIATTFSATNGVTDSAAAGTALATGNKTKNGALGVKKDLETKVNSVAYNVGLDLIDANFDFYAGSDFLDPTNKKAAGSNSESLYTLVDKAGYTIARGYKDYQKKAKKSDKLILLQPATATDNSAIPYAIDRKKGDMTLTEITRAGINFLSKDLSKGFFLMVEGGKIDWACHSNDAATVFHEVMDMDNAIKVAYEFYEQHPDETLIVVTADHETGGIVLGKGPYTLNLQALKSQKVSESGYTKIVNELRKKYKNQVPWEVIKQSLKDNFGFWDSIQLNEKQEASLKKVYDESFSGKEIDLTKSEYQQDEPLAAEAKRILDDIALVGWTSGGHSGGYVPVFAIGAGAQLIQGRIDNTEIPVKIAEAAGYPNN